MEKPVLVIMAAGMGSRYGGLKQIDAVDQEGDIIIDFSIYDAVRAGFRKVIFIIKKEIEQQFKEAIGNRIAEFVDVDYVYQEIDMVPDGYLLSAERRKPWGTGHAILSCKNKINGPFAVINADDYYGVSAFEKIYQFLVKIPDDKQTRYAMVGYELENTLTEYGTVSRGVCTLKDGMLQNIVERTKIRKNGKSAEYYSETDDEWKSIPDHSIVSMNLWGFTGTIFKELENAFTKFLKEEYPLNPLKSEFFLPSVVENMIFFGKAEVKVLKSEDKWFGVTYKEDKQMVMEAIQKMKSKEIYPYQLWQHTSKAAELVGEFCIEGDVFDCRKYGHGHINDTYLVSSHNGTIHRYILQKINKSVFKDTDKLMHNIMIVTSFLKNKIKEDGGDITRETLNVIPTKEGKSYLKDSQNNSWRMYSFIEDAVCYEQVRSKEDFYQSAYAFGRFQYLLADLDAAQLYETIADFHNTPKRYDDFLKAVEIDKCNRVKEVSAEIQFLTEHKDDIYYINSLLKNREIPLRVTHNDTKLNNIMIDKKTGKGICVIDLDTVMPGLAVFDFGDSIRFGANTAMEDERDLSKVSLNLENYEAYVKGYILGCGGKLTSKEVSLLPMGAKTMTLECGMRFLTDYLSGDVYFKIQRPDHNLDRCRTQFQLVKDMEKKWNIMNEIVAKYIQL